MKYAAFKVAFALLFLTSCFVKSPKYSTVKQVLTLQPGMTSRQVEEILGVKPYDLKARNDTSIVLIYVYRVTDRRTISFYTKATNGKDAIGKYVQLDVTYSNDDKVIRIESCDMCPDNLVSTSKIDFERILLFVTVSLPLALVFFGLKN
jgi:hypothetical protein